MIDLDCFVSLSGFILTQSTSKQQPPHLTKYYQSQSIDHEQKELTYSYSSEENEGGEEESLNGSFGGPALARYTVPRKSKKRKKYAFKKQRFLRIWYNTDI